VLKPEQFAVNEAWIAFQLNREPLQTKQDGPLNCIALMDAASCFILGTEIISALEAEPNVLESRRLLKMGRKHKRQLPKILFIASGLTSDILAHEAAGQNIEVRRVPENELLIFIREARDGFEEHVAARGRDA
jgi:hypothetical protein